MPTMSILSDDGRGVLLMRTLIRSAALWLALVRLDDYQLKISMSLFHTLFVSAGRVVADDARQDARIAIDARELQMGAMTALSTGEFIFASQMSQARKIADSWILLLLLANIGRASHAFVANAVFPHPVDHGLACFLFVDRTRLKAKCLCLPVLFFPVGCGVLN